MGNQARGNTIKKGGAVKLAPTQDDVCSLIPQEVLGSNIKQHQSSH